LGGLPGHGKKSGYATEKVMKQEGIVGVVTGADLRGL